MYHIFFSRKFYSDFDWNLERLTLKQIQGHKISKGLNCGFQFM